MAEHELVHILGRRRKHPDMRLYSFELIKCIVWLYMFGLIKCGTATRTQGDKHARHKRYS